MQTITYAHDRTHFQCTIHTQTFDPSFVHSRLIEENETDRS